MRAVLGRARGREGKEEMEEGEGKGSIRVKKGKRFSEGRAREREGEEGMEEGEREGSGSRKEGQGRGSSEGEARRARESFPAASVTRNQLTFVKKSVHSGRTILKGVG